MGLPEVVAVVVVGCSGEVVEVLDWAWVLEQVVFLVVVLVVVALVVESWGMHVFIIYVHPRVPRRGCPRNRRHRPVGKHIVIWIFFCIISSEFFSLFFSGSSSPRWYRKYSRYDF